MKNILIFALAAFAGIFAVSCSNYRLAGTPVHLPFNSVYVAPVKNTSYAPQASNLLTNAIIQAINQVPNLHSAYKNDAQAILEVKIVDYKKEPVATSASDTALAASYNVVAVAECTLTRANGEVIFKNRKVRASAMLYTGSASNPTYNDVLGNEYQNMPVLMRELGLKVRDAVVGIW